MKFVRFTILSVLGLALLVGLGLSSNVRAQAENIFITAIHSDLLNAQNHIASNSGAGNTIWNFYVWSGTHPSLYGMTTLGLQPFPALAADFASPIVKEGDFYVSTVKLLEGVEWSDGVEITAEDVAFTYNSFVREIEPGTSLGTALGAGYSTFYDPRYLDHVEAVDKYTVKFYLKEKPGLSVWEFGMLGAWIYPKHYWEDKFEQAFASADPVATLLAFDGSDEPSGGPFIFRKWEPGAFSEVAKNPNYFFTGTKFREHEGGGYSETLPDGTVREAGDTTTPVIWEAETGPFVDGVLYSLYGTAAAAALALINGEVDYQFQPLGYGLATLRQFEETPGIRVLENASSGFFYLSFNMRKSPYNYLGFRRAVRCIIDKEFVAEELLQGQVIPAYVPVPPGNGFWYRELTPEERDQGCVGFSLAEKVERAVQYLKEEGFTWEQEPQVNPDGSVTPGRGIIDPEGNKVPLLEHLHPNAAYDNNRNIFGLHIVDRMNLLGIPVRDVPAGFNNIVTLVFDQQDFDQWQLGWGLGVYPDWLVVFFHSRFTGPGNYSPQGGVCSSRENAINGCQENFDALAEQFEAEQDLQKAQQLAFELERIIYENAAYIPTHYVIQWDAYRADRVNWQGLEDQKVFDGLQGGAGYRALVKKVTQ